MHHFNSIFSLRHNICISRQKSLKNASPSLFDEIVSHKAYWEGFLNMLVLRNLEPPVLVYDKHAVTLNGAEQALEAEPVPIPVSVYHLGEIWIGSYQRDGQMLFYEHLSILE